MFMDKDYIDYSQLIDDAMHVIVRKALEVATNKSLLGEHHFFISFMTNHPGVTISDKLKKRYPKEMTIVLQYQFEDLRVSEKEFNVILSFDNVKERIVIPFSSLTAFADPSVKFGLQFRHIEIDEAQASPDSHEVMEFQKKDDEGKSKKRRIDLTTEDKSNVISFENYKKKPKSK